MMDTQEVIILDVHWKDAIEEGFRKLQKRR